jgi:hypothetical protein
MPLSATHVLLEMPRERPGFEAAWLAKATEAEASSMVGRAGGQRVP